MQTQENVAIVQYFARRPKRLNWHMQVSMGRIFSGSMFLFLYVIGTKWMEMEATRYLVQVIAIVYVKSVLGPRYSQFCVFSAISKERQGWRQAWWRSWQWCWCWQRETAPGKIAAAEERTMERLLAGQERSSYCLQQLGILHDLTYRILNVVKYHNLRQQRIVRISLSMYFDNYILYTSSSFFIHH